MYYDRRKKYVEIMVHIKNEEIIGYTVLKTDSQTLGWEKISDYEVEIFNNKKLINEEMIRVIRQLIYEGYEILGRKEKNR